MGFVQTVKTTDYAKELAGGKKYDEVDIATWKAWWNEKATLLEDAYGSPVPWKQFYQELFPPDSLQPFNPLIEEKDGTKHRKQRWIDARQHGRGNAIVLREDIYTNSSGETKVKRQRLMVFDQRFKDMTFFLKGNSKSLVAPVSYFGWQMKQKYAHEIFAIVLDIDYVSADNLRNLLFQFKKSGINHRVEPTFVVNSGHGLHLYFFLKEPVRLYNNTKPIITKLKNSLVDLYWNQWTSLRNQKDQGSCVQDFRAVGSCSKLDEPGKRDFPVTAYRCSDQRFSLYELNDLIFEKEKQADIDAIYELPEGNRYPTMPLKQAKETYPAWYAEMLAKYGSEENFPKPVDKGNRRYKKEFIIPRSVYDRFLQQAKSYGWVGGRYNILRALCCIGIKCSDYHETRNPNPVTDEEIIRDVWNLYPLYSSLSASKSQQFTKADVEAALEVLRPENRELARRSTREWIETKTNIKFPPAIERKGQLKKYHLEDCRDRKVKMKRRGQNFKNPEGRPAKQVIVEAWRAEHPTGTKAECVRETGLSKPTVYKWWNV